jgi:hypothetical protein
MREGATGDNRDGQDHEAVCWGVEVSGWWGPHYPRTQVPPQEHGIGGSPTERPLWDYIVYTINILLDLIRALVYPKIPQVD